MADLTKCEEELKKIQDEIAASGGLPTQQQAVDLLQATYCVDIVWQSKNSLVLDVSGEEPCSSEAKYKIQPNNVTHEQTINAMLLVAATKVTRRYTNSHSPKKRFTMPCPACFGTSDSQAFDDLAVKNWKNKRPFNQTNPNYKLCAVPKDNPKYFDICCILNEIFSEGSGTKPPICDMSAHKYGDVRTIYNKVWGKVKGSLGPNPCPGAGALVFNAKATVGVRVTITYQASAYYKDGEKRARRQASKTIFFGKDIESVSPLQAIVELKDTDKPRLNPQEKKAYANYDGLPKGCAELQAQAQREGRPCGFGCSPCPWYEVSIACGLKFWECEAHGKDNLDIRCTESGYSVSDNSSPLIQLDTLGQVINKSISGWNSGACKDNQVQRKGALPCTPPEPISNLASQALSVADKIKRHNWSGEIEALVDKAIENAKNALPPDPCSPKGYGFRGIQIVPLYK